VILRGRPGTTRRPGSQIALVAAVCALIATSDAKADRWQKEEARYKRAYPAFMHIALPRVPYRNALLRVVYFSGGVGVYYAVREDRKWACKAATESPGLFKRAAKKQLFGDASSYRDIRAAGVSEAQVLTAYHRGALLACSRKR
jgi:hypothetical protein